ncbi:MAG TPA: Stp1/IreP family PP2C-type Ser/Thr phosphatase [Gaiellaceae bacterium]|nr:Stp1/IreP family PP2C-type Ser/Thr phosphatase [Gaiellaceae bacterium]
MRLGESAGRTHPGKVRRRNEDSYVLDPPLFAVADGMGGAQAGEVASRLTAAAFREFHEADELPPEERVQAIIQEANRRIYDRAHADSGFSGMGTTVTAALLLGGRVTIGHVGDSRAYRIRDGTMEQLTDDHSLVGDLMRSGRLTAEEADAHPQRSVITRALGTDPEVDVDTVTVDAAPGDLFLLCSDGLTTMVGDDDILGVLAAAPTLDDAARELVRAANTGGGEDNVTVVLFRIEGDEETGETLAAAPAVAGNGQSDTDELEDTLTSLQPVTAPPPAVTPASPAVPPLDPPPPPARPAPRSRRRWGRRLLVLVLVLGFVALVLGGALFGISRAYFVGANDEGYIVVYQGVPFDVTDSTGLYRERYVSRLQASQLSPEERAALFDHQLVSYERARARVAVYEAEAEP